MSVKLAPNCTRRRDGTGSTAAALAHGLPIIYVALEPVDMRLGAERLGGLVRERMRAEPRSRALFVFVGKRGHWPRSRYLELAPKYWRATRGRLRPDELASPISAFVVPPPTGEATESVAAPSA